MEVPSELFRMKSLKELYLYNNNLCSLPSEIALMTTLEQLWVRLSKRLDRDLTKSRVDSGQRKPTHVSSARARSADQSEDTLRPAFEADGLVLTRHVRSGRQEPAHVAPCRNRPAQTARVARRTKVELI
jgi:hypothetical protein